MSTGPMQAGDASAQPAAIEPESTGLTTAKSQPAELQPAKFRPPESQPTELQHTEVQRPAGFKSGAEVAPHSPRTPLRWLTYLLLLPLIAVATIAFGCVSLICGLWDRSGSQQHAIARAWAKVLLLLSLSPVELVGAEKLHIHEVAVYASNHLSYYDTPVLFAKLPFQFRIVAKQALWKVPFIGWYLHRSGQVSVDQSSARAAVTSLSRGVATLKAGVPLVIFPEGGRAADGQTKAFLSGCAFMAIKAGVPLIPLTLVGTFELLPIHTYHLTPRPLKVVVGDPIPTAGLTTRDADALTQQLFQAVTETYLRHHSAHPAGRTIESEKPGE